MPLIVENAPAREPEPLTTGVTVLHAQLEAETAARLAAEARETQLAALLQELRAEIPAAEERGAERGAAPLRAEIEEIRRALDERTALEGAAKGELAEARATEARLQSELDAARAAGQEAVVLLDVVQTELADLRAQTANYKAAIADGDVRITDLRDQLAAERSTSEQAAASIDALKAEVEQLGAFRAQEAATAEQALAATRDELATALEQGAASLAALDAAHSARDEEAKVTKVLRARLADVEQTVREEQVSSVTALGAEVEALRAVVELQEQALAGAEARERALRDTPPSPAVDSSARRVYSETSHFLFAPGATGYELFERSGIAPTVGSVIDLSGGRKLRVVRVGPAPYPGAREACAYLENA